jgi:hypothetical protein
MTISAFPARRKFFKKIELVNRFLCDLKAYKFFQKLKCAGKAGTHLAFPLPNLSDKEIG